MSTLIAEGKAAGGVRAYGVAFYAPPCTLGSVIVLQPIDEPRADDADILAAALARAGIKPDPGIYSCISSVEVRPS